jgi:hypothetical protein
LDKLKRQREENAKLKADHLEDLQSMQGKVSVGKSLLSWLWPWLRGRPKEELDGRIYYIFKGESYIHNCMDGEALRDKFYDEAAEDRVFELR